MVDPIRRAAAEQERQRAIAASRAAQRPIVEELRSLGYDVTSIEDLPYSGRPYRSAVPVLLRWLPKVTDPAIKTALVRLLAVPWAKPEATPVLVAAFEQVDDAEGVDLRWTIGGALEVLAGEPVADDLLRLAQDRRYGRAREMVVLGLGKLKRPEAVDVLIGLLDDEEVTGHAVAALGMLKVERARPHLERFLTHPKAWVRTEARRALRKLDRVAAKAGPPREAPEATQ